MKREVMTKREEKVEGTVTMSDREHTVWLIISLVVVFGVGALFGMAVFETRVRELKSEVKVVTWKAETRVNKLQGSYDQLQSQYDHATLVYEQLYYDYAALEDSAVLADSKYTYTGSRAHMRRLCQVNKEEKQVELVSWDISARCTSDKGPFWVEHDSDARDEAWKVIRVR